MENNQVLATMMRNGIPSWRIATMLLSVAWKDLTDAMFQEAIQYLLWTWGDIWLRDHPEVFTDPKTRPDEPMGIHQTVAPLLPYRSCEVNGKKIFLFEHHIQDLTK